MLDSRVLSMSSMSRTSSFIMIEKISLGRISSQLRFSCSVDSEDIAVECSQNLYAQLEAQNQLHNRAAANVKRLA